MCIITFGHIVATEFPRKYGCPGALNTLVTPLDKNGNYNNEIRIDVADNECAANKLL